MLPTLLAHCRPQPAFLAVMNDDALGLNAERVALRMGRRCRALNGPDRQTGMRSGASH